MTIMAVRWAQSDEDDTPDIGRYFSRGLAMGASIAAPTICFYLRQAGLSVVNCCFPHSCQIVQGAQKRYAKYS